MWLSILLEPVVVLLEKFTTFRRQRDQAVSFPKRTAADKPQLVQVQDAYNLVFLTMEFSDFIEVDACRIHHRASTGLRGP